MTSSQMLKRVYFNPDYALDEFSSASMAFNARRNTKPYSCMARLCNDAVEVKTGAAALQRSINQMFSRYLFFNAKWLKGISHFTFI